MLRWLIVILGEVGVVWVVGACLCCGDGVATIVGQPYVA